MTLDEAIKHAEEVAEENNKCAEHIRDKMTSEIALSNATECETCADEHRQLAEWLKDYKRLLEQATSDDCVSRAEVLKQIKEWKDCEFVKMTNPYYYLEKRIQSMSPVTPAHCIAAVRFSKEDLRNICNERIEIECTHGMCKDCAKSKILNDFEGHSIVCSRFGRMAVNPDFYCANFEKRGNKNGV